MIQIGNDITIKDIAGGNKLSLGVSEGFVHTKELMKENSIKFTFNLNWMVVDFVRGDYVEHEGEKFILRKNYQPEEVNSGQYLYEMVFEGTDMQFQDFIMFYTMQGLKEAEWTLTSSARDFMVIALENIRRYFNDDSFVLGDVIDSDIQNISFDADTVFDALATIAETFKCDWYLKGKTLNLVSKYEYGDAVVLEREVSIADIKRSNDNDAEYCTRLYALGSTRNIPKNYRTTENGEAVDAIVQKRLRLPISNGDYIDAIPNMKQSEILERVIMFDDIYPRRVGTITELRSVDRTEDENNPFIVYFFKDSGLEFKLDYILPGEALMITFESGWLQGRDFELAYDEKTEEFEIIVDTSIEDMNIPNDILKPRVGDEYVIYGFDISLVSDQYIPEAEEELLEEATKWLKGITEDNATYECPNDPGYCYRNGIDLDIGQRVQMVSPIFMDGNKMSRIYGFSKSLFNKYICTYLVGDASKPSLTKKVDENMKEVKSILDVQYKETSKSIRAFNYLRTAMENETVIDKGMILTTLLRLGAKAANEWKEHAGISGIYEEDDDPAFWAGGTFEDAINNIANIVLRMDGSAQFAKNKFIIHKDGKAEIGGFELGDGRIGVVGDPNAPNTYNGLSLYNEFIKFSDSDTWVGIGTNVLPASSGATALGRFEYKSDDVLGTNYGLFFDISGGYSNIAISLLSGCISGLSFYNRQISNSQTLKHNDVYISCYNKDEIIELTLPFEPERGKIFYIRQMNSLGIKIIAKEEDDIPGDENTDPIKKPGYYIHTNGTTQKDISRNSRGQLTMLFFDGQFWCLNSISS